MEWVLGLRMAAVSLTRVCAGQGRAELSLQTFPPGLRWAGRGLADRKPEGAGWGCRKAGATSSRREGSVGGRTRDSLGEEGWGKLSLLFGETKGKEKDKGETGSAVLLCGGLCRGLLSPLKSILNNQD